MLGHLIDLLFPPRASEVLVRGATVGSVHALMAPAVHHVERYRATTLLPYRTPLVRALIREAKFRGNVRAVRLLASALRAYFDAYSGCAVLVPIPLSDTRRKERGYNQVELVAQAALIGMPHLALAAPLRRTRDTKPQTDLPRRARVRNLAGAFTADPCDPHATYLLLDDVLTTGATLTAAAAALAAAGATRIELLALSH